MTTMPLAGPIVEAATPERHESNVIERDLLATLNPLGRSGRTWIASLSTVVGIAFVAWVYQLVNGLRVTDMRNYVSWGTYMTNFVFFIGISHAGTLISAILRVTDAGWRRPITRMAEAITVIALLVGSSMVVIDMGRPDRVLNLIIHGRLQSPILWDLLSVTTYLTGSFLYLYVAMIPDMPILARNARVQGRSPRLVRFYEALSLGYRESPQHRRRLAIALGAMAVIIIPVAVSVHTVVSWVFGMTLRPGWHSTIFGPYFVVGAIYSGTAAIITAMVIFRRAYHLERYLHPEHFHKLGKILLALTLLYGYFTLSEYLTTWYGGAETDHRLLELLGGNSLVGPWFWGWATVGLFAPLFLLLFPSRRSLTSIMTASVLVNIGMWIKRYLIIVPTMQTPFIPARAAGITPHYFPSLVECTITVGAFAAFMLFYTIFSRIFPILSIWETEEDVADAAPVPTPARVFRRHHIAPASLTMLLMAGGLLAGVPWARARAQATPPDVRITLTRTTEDSVEMLVATVTANGRPVDGADVVFSVERTFGAMSLGEDQTLPDGTAAVAFPSSLPGDREGALTFHVEVLPTDEFDDTSIAVTLSGGAPAPGEGGNTPRALWSSRAPVPMVLTIVVLLAAVWGTFAFVVGQLVVLSHLREEA